MRTAGTLTSATVGGQSLAPSLAGNPQLAGVAAQAIRQTASVGLNPTPPPCVAGYALSLDDPHHPTFELLNNQDDVRARVALLRAAPGDCPVSATSSPTCGKGSRTASYSSRTAYSITPTSWRPSR